MAILQACCCANPPDIRNVNSLHMTKDQFLAVLQSKNHDLACPNQWFTTFGRSYQHCVRKFEGLDPGVHYVTVRSAELAHQIHLQLVENGILDLEPLRDGATWLGIGIGVGMLAFGVGIGAGVFVIGCSFLVRSFKGP